MDDAPRIKTILIVVALVVGLAVCAVAAFVVLCSWTWRDTTPRGPLASVSDWPEPVQDLYASLNDAGVDTETFSVYLLYGQPGETLSTVVCRVDVDDTGWRAIQRKLDLQPIPDSDGKSLRDVIVSSADPSWWPPSTSHAQYFASARLLAGDEADLYYAARDLDSGRAFVHYHFNF